MPDVDGGFQGCCCGNRGTGGIARRAEDSVWGGWLGRGVVYLRILSMSGSVCLPRAPLFHLRNLLQEKINEDLVLDCHLLSLWNGSGGYKAGERAVSAMAKWGSAGESVLIAHNPRSCIILLCVCSPLLLSQRLCFDQLSVYSQYFLTQSPFKMNELSAQIISAWTSCNANLDRNIASDTAFWGYITCVFMFRFNFR